MKNFNAIATLCIASALLSACNNDSSTGRTSAISGGGATWVTGSSIYVLDEEKQLIRVVDKSTGIISAFAGTGASGHSADGTAYASVDMGTPTSLIVAPDSSIIFTNTDYGCVQRLAAGVVTTIAGICGTHTSTGDGGLATAATLNSPTGLCVDTVSNLYITDFNGGYIRKVNHSDGIISTIGGNGSGGYDASKDGGLGTLAPMNPAGCAVDAVGSVYFTNASNDVIEKIDANGIITTVAGNGTNGSSGDGGPATSALVFQPTGIAIDQTANMLYFSDIANNTVRKIDLGSGIITLFAGTTGTPGTSGDGGAALAAQLYEPDGLAVYGGEVFIAVGYNGDHRIRKVDTNGNINTVVGTGTDGSTGDGGAATSADIGLPFSFAAWWD